MLFDDVYRYVGQYKKFQIIMSLIVAFQGKFQTRVNADPCAFLLNYQCKLIGTVQFQ